MAICASAPIETVRSNRLSQGASFYLLASITVSFLAGSSAPTPIYPLYQAEWGANSYVRKPVEFGAFVNAVSQLGIYWMLLNEAVPKR